MYDQPPQGYTYGERLQFLYQRFAFKRAMEIKAVPTKAVKIKPKTVLDSQFEELETIQRHADLAKAKKGSVKAALDIAGALDISGTQTTTAYGFKQGGKIPPNPEELLRRVLEKMDGEAKASRLEAVFLEHGYNYNQLRKAIQYLGLYRFYYDKNGPSYLAFDSRHGGVKAQG